MYVYLYADVATYVYYDDDDKEIIITTIIIVLVHSTAYKRSINMNSQNTIHKKRLHEYLCV